MSRTHHIDIPEIDRLYPYVEMNLQPGTDRFAEQGAFKHKAEAIRETIEDAERTHRINEETGRAYSDRSEVFIVIDTRTGEIVGGRFIQESERTMPLSKKAQAEAEAERVHRAERREAALES